jgi:hypothetical protein
MGKLDACNTGVRDLTESRDPNTRLQSPVSETTLLFSQLAFHELLSVAISSVYFVVHPATRRQGPIWASQPPTHAALNKVVV